MDAPAFRREAATIQDVPTDPRPISLFDVVKRAAQIVDPDGGLTHLFPTPAALMALLADFSLGWLENRLSPH